jgi:dTDP-4-dehydrorhamnose 3,5-epimerase
MQIIKTPLPGLLVIEPKIFFDSRGFFFESYNQQQCIEAGITKPFLQDNFSRSKKNVVRGLHYQMIQPQAKLVSVSRGSVYDVAVDIRRGSPTFGQWFGQLLSSENHLRMYIPAGFAHGFCVLSEEVDFCYKCTDYYCPSGERGVRWDDSELTIAWPIKEALLSPKDLEYPKLCEISSENLPIFEEDTEFVL